MPLCSTGSSVSLAQCCMHSIEARAVACAGRLSCLVLRCKQTPCGQPTKSEGVCTPAFAMADSHESIELAEVDTPRSSTTPLVNSPTGLTAEELQSPSQANFDSQRQPQESNADMAGTGESANFDTDVDFLDFPSI